MQVNNDDRWEITQLDGFNYTLRNIATGRYLHQTTDYNVDTVAASNIDEAAHWEIAPVG